MCEEFVKERITQLRLKKGVSEYQMSYDLGHSRGYIYNISSGKALPPLKEFFGICDLCAAAAGEGTAALYRGACSGSGRCLRYAGCQLFYPAVSAA